VYLIALCGQGYTQESRVHYQLSAVKLIKQNYMITTKMVKIIVATGEKFQ